MEDDNGLRCQRLRELGAETYAGNVENLTLVVGNTDVMMMLPDTNSCVLSIFAFKVLN